LPDQAFFARHAKDTTHGTTDLRRHTHHREAIPQFQRFDHPEAQAANAPSHLLPDALIANEAKWKVFQTTAAMLAAKPQA